MALGNPGKAASLKTARPRPRDAFVAHAPDVSHRALFSRCRREDPRIWRGPPESKEERCVRGKRRSGSVKASASPYPQS